MTDTIETLSPTIVSRIAELRGRMIEASLQLAALLDTIGAPNSEVKRQVRLCLREAAEDAERMIDQFEAAEHAAANSAP